MLISLNRLNIFQLLQSSVTLPWLFPYLQTLLISTASDGSVGFFAKPVFTLIFRCFVSLEGIDAPECETLVFGALPADCATIAPEPTMPDIGVFTKMSEISAFSTGDRHDAITESALSGIAPGAFASATSIGVTARIQTRNLLGSIETILRF